MLYDLIVIVDMEFKEVFLCDGYCLVMSLLYFEVWLWDV